MMSPSTIEDILMVDIFTQYEYVEAKNYIVQTIKDLTIIHS